MSLLKVKEINEQTKNAVFGYIRLSYSQTIIPMEIQYICLLFYYLIPEQFIKCDSGLTTLSSDENAGRINDIAQMEKSEDDATRWIWLLVQGNMIIDSLTNPDIIVEWIIESNVKFCCIGIHSTYSIDAYDAFDYDWYGRDINVAEEFDRDDTIKMVLNIPQRQLRFYKNGKLSKVVFNDIEVEKKKYHLAIKVHTLQSNDKDTVKLIDFSVKGEKSLSYFSDQQSK